MTLSQRHVYLMLQEALREGKDKKLLAHVEKLRSEGYGWRYDGLADWSTSDIFAKLSELGVDADATRFREQAERAGRPKHLEDAWRGSRNWDDSPWDDFPFLAAEELWRRLAPDLPCPESIADRMSRLMSTANDPAQIAGRTDAEDLQTLMQVAAFLEQVPPAQRAARFEELLDCTTYDFASWLLDSIYYYGREHPDAIIRLADVMSDADPENAASYQGDLAVALSEAGHADAALERVRANLERFPDDVWVRIKAADVHQALDRDEEALALNVEALRTTRDPYDWMGAAERLPDVLKKLGREEEYKSIVGRHPRPNRPRAPLFEQDAAPSLGDPWDQPPPPLSSGEKVGRNEPCPCGSGKKYKKCCLGEV